MGIPNLLPTLRGRNINVNTDLERGIRLAIDGNVNLHSMGTFRAPSIVVNNDLSSLIKCLITFYTK